MACEIAADIQQQWSAKTPDPILQLNNPDADKITVNEALAKKSLARYHVPVPPGHRAQSVEQAVEQAGKIGFPVALKALGFAHKTEKNAVRLNLNCAKEVARAAHDILLLTNEIYVEAMIDSVVAELVVGIVRESPMGLVMRIGSGGVFVEILDDQITLLIPTDRAAIEQALLGLKSAPVLSGYRGKPKADFNAAVDAIVAIQEFAIANARQLLELEVNPLIIRAQDGGATAVDALMVMQENSNHD